MFTTTARKRATQHVLSGRGNRWYHQDTPKVFLSDTREPLSPSVGKLNEGAVSMDEDITQFLINNNHKWVNNIKTVEPNFFQELKKQQTPNYFYIGCSDSRVPAEQMLGLGPGDLFVYRNIANIISIHDFGVHAALQYAVDVLKVKSILVCGHYGCGGIKCATERPGFDRGILEQWLQTVRSTHRRHMEELHAIEDEEMMQRRLVEINVIEQCINVYRSGCFQLSRQRTAKDPNIKIPLPRIHPLVFDNGTGEIKKLMVNWPEIMASLGEVYDLYNLGGDSCATQD